MVIKMADNYGFTFAYNTDLTPSGRTRVSQVYRTREQANKSAKTFRNMFGTKRKNVRVVKATKSEYRTFLTKFQTGK
tara:strand:+ start:632 stop:862 length:231 start_codon:yes stop_codon:yes gene_type:complete